MEHTFFDLLGLPRQFAVDKKLLEKNYLLQSRRFHPDFFTSAPELERNAANIMASRINLAYTTLKDNFLRACYLVELKLGPSQNTSDKPKPTMELLEFSMDWRMELMAAQASQNETAIASLKQQLDAHEEQVEKQFAQMIDQAELNAAEVQSILNSWRFLRSMRKELS